MADRPRAIGNSASPAGSSESPGIGRPGPIKADLNQPQQLTDHQSRLTLLGSFPPPRPPALPAARGPMCEALERAEPGKAPLGPAEGVVDEQDLRLRHLIPAQLVRRT